MGLLPIPSPRFTQGASRAGIRRAAALYDKRLLPPSFTSFPGPHTAPLRHTYNKGRKPALDTILALDNYSNGLIMPEYALATCSAHSMCCKQINNNDALGHPHIQTI